MGYSGKVHRLGIPDAFPGHATTQELYEELGLDKASLLRTLNNLTHE